MGRSVLGLVRHVKQAPPILPAKLTELPLSVELGKANVTPYPLCLQLVENLSLATSRCSAAGFVAAWLWWMKHMRGALQQIPY
jgi:hypothetical protein